MKKYLIYGVEQQGFFNFADIDGTYWSMGEYFRTFDTEQEAIDRIKYEAEIFPDELKGKLYAIVPVLSL